MNFDQSLANFIKNLDIDYYGVADLTSAHHEIARQGGEIVCGYPLAISIGLVLLDSIIDRLPQRESQAVSTSYYHHYNAINRRLDEIVTRVSGEIQRAGYGAFPVPASERYDNERICAVFSHKLAAHLAGLGWIGKSCLLITPKHGPRVRWATILTDAPVSVTGQSMKTKCGNCRQCVDICPPQAVTGRLFAPEEAREERYDARLCQQYHHIIKKQYEADLCGLCVYVCPYGRKNTS